eukprot:scaffold318280_cov17-Prasinocladus_malaysianus.AAC.1
MVYIRHPRTWVFYPSGQRSLVLFLPDVLHSLTDKLDLFAANTARTGQLVCLQHPSKFPLLVQVVGL